MVKKEGSLQIINTKSYQMVTLLVENGLFIPKLKTLFSIFRAKYFNKIKDTFSIS